MRFRLICGAARAFVFLAGGALLAGQNELATTLAFSDSGQDRIQAVTRDAPGYLYVAGTTNSPDFPVKNAAQGQIGSSQLMRSTDRGATWVKLTSPPPAAGAPQIVPHPVLPQTLFATSSNVYGTSYNSIISKSTDGGATWRGVDSVTSNRPTGATGLTFSPANPSMIVADLSTGLAFSSDGGETWATSACLFLECGSTGDQLIADPLNPGGFAASFAAGQGPYISSDGGHTFTSIRPNICCGSAVVLYDPFHRNGIYVAYNLGAMGNLFFSADKGNTWTTKSVPNTSLSGIQTLVADPDIPNVVYAITLAGSGLFQSTDAGTTWTALANPNFGAGMVAMPRACGPGGGLFATTSFSPDFGKTWQALPFREVTNVAVGPGCALYAARNPTTDAFVAKLTPDGREILWATFLGGNENDSASVLAVDARGGVYVGGATSSTDFPAASQTGAFGVKLDSSGRIVYSTVFNASSVTGIAVDAQGNAWLSGLAAAGLPVTAGALDTQYDSLDGDGYLAKLAPAGNLVFATYLGTKRSVLALAIDSVGQPVVAGQGSFFGHTAPANANGGFVLRLSADGLQVTGAMNVSGSASNSEGPEALAFDAAGDIFVLGNTAASDFVTTPGAYVSASRSGTCNLPGRFTGLVPGDIFVMKLNASGFTPVYSALLAGPCGSQPGNLSLADAGRVTLSLSSGSSFPLKNPPIAVAPSCGLPQSLTPTSGNGVISQLSADGSALLFSTYTGACGVPAIAAAAGSSVFAGLNFTGAADPRARIVEFPVRNELPVREEPRR